MDVRYHDSIDASSGNGAGQKIFYTHHKKKDALHYESFHATSRNTDAWKTFYRCHMKTDIHYHDCMEFQEEYPRTIL